MSGRRQEPSSCSPAACAEAANPTQQRKWRIRAAALALAFASVIVPVSHSTAQELLLKYTVTRTTQRVAKPPLPLSNPSDEKATSSREMVVRLGKGYFSVEQQEQRVVYDFRSRRLVCLNLKDLTHQDDSLFAVVGYRSAEIRNRMRIRDLVHEVTSRPGETVLDRFDLETLFCLELAGDQSKPCKADVKNIDPKGGRAFLYRGETFVRFVPSAHNLTGSHRRMFGRFLTYCCRIHPRIRADIEAAGKIPEELHYRSRNLSKEEAVTYRLLAVTGTQSDSARISGEFKPVATKDDPLAGILKKLRDDNWAKAPEKKAATGFAEQAIRKKNYLDALLALMEYGLQSGQSVSAELRKFMPQARTEEQSQLFLRSMSGGGREQVREQLKRLAKIDRKKLKKGYVLDIFRANMESALGQRELAERLFLGVLKFNPYVTGVYKDLGQLYFRRYQMDRAWRCWDTARRLCPDHHMLKSIHRLEQQLEKSFPDYF